MAIVKWCLNILELARPYTYFEGWAWSGSSVPDTASCGKMAPSDGYSPRPKYMARQGVDEKRCHWYGQFVLEPYEVYDWR